MSKVLFRQGLKSDYTSLAVKDSSTFYWLEDSQELYLGEVEITSGSALAAVIADVAKNASDIADILAVLNKLEGDETVNDSIKNIIKGYVDPINASLANKTTEVVEGTNGIGRIFNEVDGGGAKFEHNDGTWSYVGVNDGGENGLAGQLYVVKKNSETDKYEGTRLNLTKNGFYYVKGDSSAYTANNEIATIGDLEGVSGDASSKTIYFIEDTNDYKLYQGSDSSDMSQNTLVGTIQKDKFLKDAKVVTLTYNDGKLYDDETDVTALVKGDSIPATAADAGKYIKMEMQNVEAPLYMSVRELVDVYTANNQTAEVTIAIDLYNNITATIGQVAASKIMFEVSGGTSTTVQTEIEGIKGDIEDLQTNLTWQAIE